MADMPMAPFRIAPLSPPLPLPLPLSLPLPAGAVPVGEMLEDTGVTAAFVAFVHATLSGMVALSRRVRSAHYAFKGACASADRARL